MAWFESKMGALARLMGPEIFLVATMKCSGVDADEVSRVLAKPGRGRRLRVVDAQRRSRQMGESDDGVRRFTRDNPPRSLEAPKGNGHGQRCKRVRKRQGEDRSSGSHPQTARTTGKKALNKSSHS